MIADILPAGAIAHELQVSGGRTTSEVI